MATFPTLANGETVHLPWSLVVDFKNTSSDMAHGWRFSYNLRSTALHRWELTFDGLSDADLDTLRTFWLARGGAYEEFSFTDPQTSDTYSKCRFVGDEFAHTAVGPNENRLRLMIQEYA